MTNKIKTLTTLYATILLPLCSLLTNHANAETPNISKISNKRYYIMFSSREKNENTYKKLFVIKNNDVFIRTIMNNKFTYSVPDDGCYDLACGANICVNDGKIVSIDGKYPTIANRNKIANIQDEFFTEKQFNCNMQKFDIINHIFIERKSINGFQTQLYIPDYYNVVKLVIYQHDKIDDTTDSVATKNSPVQENRSDKDTDSNNGKYGYRKSSDKNIKTNDDAKYNDIEQISVDIATTEYINNEAKHKKIQAFILSEKNDVGCSPFELYEIYKIPDEEKNVNKSKRKTKKTINAKTKKEFMKKVLEESYKKMLLKGYTYLQPFDKNDNLNKIVLAVNGVNIDYINIIATDFKWQILTEQMLTRMTNSTSDRI